MLIFVSSHVTRSKSEPLEQNDDFFPGLRVAELTDTNIGRDKVECTPRAAVKLNLYLTIISNAAFQKQSTNHPKINHLTIQCGTYGIYKKTTFHGF